MEAISGSIEGIESWKGSKPVCSLVDCEGGTICGEKVVHGGFGALLGRHLVPAVDRGVKEASATWPGRVCGLIHPGDALQLGVVANEEGDSGSADEMLEKENTELGNHFERSKGEGGGR